MAKNPAKMIVNKLPKVKIAFDRLSDQEVLVGIPDDKNERKEGEMNNATLGYIHNYGSPANNIPARPFMEPGIKAAKDKIVALLKSGAQKATEANDAAIEQALNKVGLIASSSIKNIITAGIPPTLKWSSVKARIRNKTAVKGAKKALEAGGLQPNMGDVKPLIATGQLRNSITYVLRRKGK